MSSWSEAISFSPPTLKKDAFSRLNNLITEILAEIKQGADRKPSHISECLAGIRKEVFGSSITVKDLSEHFIHLICTMMEIGDGVTLEAIIEVLHLILREQISSLNALLGNIVIPLMGILRKEVSSLIDKKASTALKLYHQFLRKILPTLGVADDPFIHVRFSVRYIPIIVKRLVETSNTIKSFDHDLSFSMLRGMLQSHSFLSQIVSICRYTTKCLEILDNSLHKNEKSLFQAVFDTLTSNQTVNELKLTPLFCSFEDYVEYVKDHASAWTSWIHAATLYIYMKRIADGSGPSKEEASKLLVDGIFEANDFNTFSYILAYQCDENRACSSKLKEIMFEKLKHIFKEHESSEWTANVNRMAMCCVEICASDKNMAKAIVELLTKDLFYCVQSSKEAPLFGTDEKKLKIWKNRATVSLCIVKKVIKHLSEMEVLGNTVKQLMSLFHSRLGQIRQCKEDWTIRDGIAGIIHDIEQGSKEAQEYLKTINFDVQVKHEENHFRSSLMQDTSASKRVAERWMSIETVSQACDSCKVEHEVFVPHHKRFGSHIVERKKRYRSWSVSEGKEKRQKST